MNKKVISLVLFIVVFIAVYLIVCFAIPGMRIKLEAEPFEYFVKSIRHMAFVKIVISFIAALLVGILPLVIKRK